MSEWILIIFVSTSSYAQSGAAGVSQVFNSQQTCSAAGEVLAQDTHRRGNFVLTWGCFKK